MKQSQINDSLVIDKSLSCAKAIAIYQIVNINTEVNLITVIQVEGKCDNGTAYWISFIQTE